MSEVRFYKYTYPVSTSTINWLITEHQKTRPGNLLVPICNVANTLCLIKCRSDYVLTSPETPLEVLSQTEAENLLNTLEWKPVFPL